MLSSFLLFSCCCDLFPSLVAVVAVLIVLFSEILGVLVNNDGNDSAKLFDDEAFGSLLFGMAKRDVDDDNENDDDGGGDDRDEDNSVSICGRRNKN